MLETIVRLLNEAETDGWEITDTCTEGWEFYFIRHALDQHRVKHTEHIEVNVYRKFDEFLGKAGAEIPVTASEDEIRELIGKLSKEALYVRNPVYTLNEPVSLEAQPEEAPDVRAIAKDFLNAMNELPESETADINSYEIFVNSERRRFLNSNGIDVTSVCPSSMLEVVVNARRDGHEIELYRLYTSGSCDREHLKEEISQTLSFGKDRLNAEKTPNPGKCDVLFSTDAVTSICEYFISRVEASMKFRQLTDWEIDKPIAAEQNGDRVTVKAVRTLKNSSKNSAFDKEGAPVRDLTLIRDGIAENYWGSRQYSSYLGVKDSFIPGNFSVEGGTKSEAEIRSGTYLEVVEFSDFQVEAITGAIAGEIRLGYLHEGDSVKIVSGGSVSGTMTDFVKDMEMSAAQKQYDNLLVPSLIRLKQVSVTGAE